MTINNKILNFIQKNYVFLILMAIVIIGTILRFKGLLFNSYWVDELYSASFSNPSYSLGKMFEETTIIDVHPPLYQAILWIWFKTFGYTEFVGRSLSVFFGVLGIVAIYFLGKELFNKHVGLYAALIASMNHFLIYYSQETRSYALLFLLTVISYIFFIRTIDDSRKRNIILYWIVTVLLLYTHYISFFIVSTQVFVFFFYIFKFPEKRKKLIVLSLLMALIFILSLLPILEYIPLDRKGLLHWVHEPSALFFLSYIYGYFKSNALFLLFATSGLVSLVYLFNIKSSDKEKIALILLLIWIMMGYFIPYLKGVISTPILYPRYTIYIVPAIIIFVSYGIWRLGSWKREILLSLVVFFSLYHLFFNYYSIITKDQWREVLQNVNKYDPLPIYENVRHRGWADNINLYQTYARMLQIDTKIYNSEKLKEDLKNARLPECFWVLDESIKNSNIIKNRSVQKVFEINYTLENGFKTEGILYSYNIKPKTCASKAGIKKVILSNEF